MSAATLDQVVAYVRRLSDADTRRLTDRQLLERFTNARDEWAFAEIVRRHGPMVLMTCRRVLRHEQDAEDAFQAVFLVLARKANSIRQHDSIAGWLYQVAHRLAARASILAARRASRSLPLVRDPVAKNPGPDTLQTALAEELARLPEQYRAAIVLCYLQGKTQTEAAALLATTTNAINSRLKRARDLLRYRLARNGLVLTATPITHALFGEAAHALSPALIAHTARVAFRFAIHPSATTGASAVAMALAQGALQEMIPAPFKILSALVLVLAMLTSGTLLVPSSAQDDPTPRDHAPAFAAQEPKLGPKKDTVKKPRQCILLWMSGGPSQIDTFDPKAGNIAMFKPIDTPVKGVQFGESLPLLAKQANRLAVLRGVGHREGDHARGTYLMQTGFAPGGADYPAFTCVLAKELGDDKRDVPRFVSINPIIAALGRTGPGILGPKYAPLDTNGEAPPLEIFQAPDVPKEKAAALHKAMTNAFDLNAEKAEVRDAYGRGRFGTGCLLARRLIEAGVPVVEVTQTGWDTHANAPAATTKLCGDLDAGMASLLKDLHERKMLDHTLVVWMGEFGRTPRINNVKGRDHWPFGFTVVLAGAGIKGGQAIGKTSVDSLKIEEGAVSPQELLATIYQAVGVDASKTNRAPGGQYIPLVEKGNHPVKQALR